MFLTSATFAGLCLGGVACTHHHHHHDEVAARPVYTEPGPPPPPPPPGPVVIHEEVYDERGVIVQDPVVVERVRYYRAAPQEIIVRDNRYYFRGHEVRDPREIHYMEMARQQDRYRAMHR